MAGVRLLRPADSSGYFFAGLIVKENEKLKIGTIVGTAFVLSVTFLTNAHAVVLQIESGSLMGALDVDVDGTAYDVRFLDGTCVDLYDGCDENSDFPFTNLSNLNDGQLALAANNALLDQVFIDSSLGLFDSDPTLTNGCTAPGGCYVFTPRFVNAAGSIGSDWIFNRNAVNGDIATGSGGGFDLDTANVPEYTRAVWSVANIDQNQVPSPASLLLVASGMVGMIGGLRSRAAVNRDRSQLASKAVSA